MKERSSKPKKLNQLLKSSEDLFHTQDLALLWSVENRNTLYTTIKRYVKKGFLIRIQRGFYSKVRLDQVDPVRLGISFLHRYSYLSTESVLVKEGVIFQSVPYITLVSNKSQKFEVGGNLYRSRQMKDSFLFNEAGIREQEASLERAVADLLYYDPKYHFDAPKFIDWDKVKKIQKRVGYE